MMSSIRIAGISTRGVTFVIVGIRQGNSSTTWIMIHWSNIFARITFCVQIKSAWIRNLWYSTPRWISKRINLKRTPMVSPKTPEEMLEELTSRVSTTGRHTKIPEEAGEIEREGKEEMEEVEEGAEIPTLKLFHSQPHNRCVGMSLLIRGKWRSKRRS